MATCHREPYTDKTPALPGLSDYATKIWAGLIAQFQAPRYCKHCMPACTRLIVLLASIKMIADQAIADIGAGKAFNVTAALATTLQAAVEFENMGWNSTLLPSTPQGKAVDVCQAMLQKYRNSLVCSC